MDVVKTKCDTPHSTQDRFPMAVLGQHQSIVLEVWFTSEKVNISLF